jgi:hypothetical protein
VRGCGGETIERVQLLLASEHHLGGGQRVRHLPGLLGQPPDVEREKHHARQHGGQNAELVELRYVEAGAAVPGQRMMVRHQPGAGACGQHAEHDGVAERHGGCRDGDGRHQQERERILDAARQIEQPGQLEDVVGQQAGRQLRAEARAGREANAQEHVEPGRQGDQRQADAEGQREAQHEIDEADGQQLADHTEPAQPDRGLQPQPALERLFSLPFVLGHRVSLVSASDGRRARGAAQLASGALLPQIGGGGQRPIPIPIKAAEPELPAHPLSHPS